MLVDEGLHGMLGSCDLCIFANSRVRDINSELIAATTATEAARLADRLGSKHHSVCFQILLTPSGQDM